MKTSCNGCRVLRKGCSDDCTIRPCLQWIKSSDSQAHATVFLAKFYGRIGLLNLISAGPDHHRPAIFRSMLYEACGRIVDPIRGSVGLLWSGKWQLCQAAVEAVLQGLPITPIGSSDAAPSGSTLTPPLTSYDIRHVDRCSAPALNKVVLHRSRYKRSAPAGEKRPRPASSPAVPGSTGFGGPGWKRFSPVEAPRAPSHESGSRVSESLFSVESDSLFSVGSSHVSQAEPSVDKAEAGEVGLELTLGFKPAAVVADCGRGGTVQD